MSHMLYFTCLICPGLGLFVGLFYCFYKVNCPSSFCLPFQWRHRIQMNEVLVCYLLLEFGEYSTGPQGVCFSHFGVLEAILKFEVGF